MLRALPAGFAALASRLSREVPIDDNHTREILRFYAVLVKRVQPMDTTWFQISEDDSGTWACVAFDGQPPGNGISWLPDNPARIRWIDASGLPYLGWMHLRDRMIQRRSATLVDNAEDWVSAAADSLFVLDWSVFDPAVDLAGLRGVECANPALADRLTAAFRPKIAITVKSRPMRDAA